MEEIFLKSRRIMLLGPINSGKTYLFHRITKLWKKRGYRFIELDCDVGQSTLGLPTTINSIGRKIHNIFFYGFTSPRHHPTRFLSGVAKLNRRGRIITDTTGYIEFPKGLELKREKIEILRPDLIVALPAEEAFWDVFLNSIRVKVLRMERSPKVRERGPKERENYRRKRFEEYFSKTEEVEIEVSRLCPVKLGASPSNGSLVSFRKKGRDIFLGYVKKISGETAKILIPKGKKPTDEVLFSPHLYKGFPEQLSLF